MKMKRILAVIFALVMCLAFAGCASGAAPRTVSTQAPAAVPEAAAPTAEPTPEPAPAEDPVVIAGNTIALRDDGSGEDDRNEEMAKRVVLTTRNINYTGTTGPITYTVESVQVAEIKALGQDGANMLGLEVGQSAMLFAVQLSVENTSDADITFYPYMSTIITSDKEQVTSDWLLSDSVGGEFLGNVVMQGQVYWICPRTDPDSLTHVQWRIDAPVNGDYDPCGDPVKIEFEFPQ